MSSKSKKEVAEDVLLASFVKNIRDGFETDKDLETQDGVKFDYGKYGSFICKRAVSRNTEYSKALREKIVPYLESRGELKDGEDDQIAARKLAEVYVDTIIMGIVTAEGQPIPYDDMTKKALVEIFVSCPDLFARLQSDVSSAANFKKKRLEDELKN